MSSTNEYLTFVLEQLSELQDVSFKKMMGEYILYYKGKIFGGIYDDRFLVKNTPKAKELMPDATEELPYTGGKTMLLVDSIEDKDFLAELIVKMCGEL